MNSPPLEQKSALRLQVARSNMSAAQDCVPSGPVRRRYLICSTPRSGSTLLGDYLMASGFAGVPYEYLNESHLVAFGERIGKPITDLGAYLAQVERLRSSAQGVFGMKAHYRHTAALLRTPDILTGFLRRFGKAIQIIRRDKIAQAISAYKAQETGFWTRRHEELAENPPPAPVYSASRIAEALAQTLTDERGWADAIGLAGIDTLTVAYEDLVARPDETLAAVFTFLEIPAILPIRLQSSLKRQADDTNAQFRARFLAEIDGRPGAAGGLTPRS